MATSDLPDAPWIVESWWSGPDPDYEETPYDIRGENDFLEGADAEFGWRILAWELDVDTDTIEDDGGWQDTWLALTEKTRKLFCARFERMHRDDAAELYNEYWRRFRA